jgi:hypothetical protein
MKESNVNLKSFMQNKQRNIEMSSHFRDTPTPSLATFGRDRGDGGERERVRSAAALAYANGVKEGKEGLSAGPSSNNHNSANNSSKDHVSGGHSASSHSHAHHVHHQHGTRPHAPMDSKKRKGMRMGLFLLVTILLIRQWLGRIRRDS